MPRRRHAHWGDEPVKRVFAAVVLLLRFVKAVFVSGLQTVAVIVKSGRMGGGPPPAALT